MYTIQSDVRTTRRQRLHHVFDDTGTLCWSGKDIDSALHFLIVSDQIETKLHGQAFDFLLSIAQTSE